MDAGWRRQLQSAMISTFMKEISNSRVTNQNRLIETETKYNFVWNFPGDWLAALNLVAKCGHFLVR